MHRKSVAIVSTLTLAIVIVAIALLRFDSRKKAAVDDAQAKTALDVGTRGSSDRFATESRRGNAVPAFEVSSDSAQSNRYVPPETKEDRAAEMTREQFLQMQAVRFALTKMKVFDRAVTEEIFRLERNFAASARRFLDVSDAERPAWMRDMTTRRKTLEKAEADILGGEQRFEEFDQIRLDKFNELNLAH